MIICNLLWGIKERKPWSTWISKCIFKKAKRETHTTKKEASPEEWLEEIQACNDLRLREKWCVLERHWCCCGLNCTPLQIHMLNASLPVPQNEIGFWVMVFKGVINLKWDLLNGLSPIWLDYYKKSKFGQQTCVCQRRAQWEGNHLLAREKGQTCWHCDLNFRL